MRKYPDNSDQEIVELYLSGEFEAFEELVFRYTAPLYRYARTFVITNDAADDIVQLTFIKIWKNLQAFDVQRSIKPWLFTILRNTALDELRKKKSLAFSALAYRGEEEDLPFEDTIVDTSPLPDELVAFARDKDYFEQKLAEYPKDKQDILILHLYQGLTFQEISEITGRPLNTVKSVYRRLTEAMTKEIAELKERHAPKSHNNA